MPSKRKHVSMATKNERFFEHFDLDNSPFLEWAVTGLFYSLIHYIEAYLADRLNDHTSSHFDREPRMDRISDLRRIYNEYRHLKDQSRQGRYLGLRFTSDEVKKLNHDYFQPAKSHLKSLL